MNRVGLFLFCILATFSLFAQNTSTPRWASKAPLPRGLFFRSAAVAISGKMYIVTPWNVYEYDPKTDRWTDEKAVLSPFRHDFETVALNGKLYVVGGCTGGEDAKMEDHNRTGAVDEYDPATHKWRSLAPMPTPRMALGVAAAEGKIYAIGGVDWKTPANAVEVYDPATNSWTKKKNWSKTNLNTVAVQLVPGKIHVLGIWGSDWMPFGQVLEEYDTISDTFRSLRNPDKPRYCSGHAVVAGRLVTFGGHVTEDHALPTVEAYEPAKNTWTTLANLPDSRSCPAALDLDGKLYVAGGAAVPWKDSVASVVVAETNDVTTGPR